MRDLEMFEHVCGPLAVIFADVCPHKMSLIQEVNFRFGAQPLGVFIVCNNFGLRMI